MYKTILVPLDGSERAETIFPHVEELAMHYEATVILMHVVELPMILASPYDALPSLTPEEIEQKMDEAADYLAKWEEKLKAREIDSRSVVEYGPVASRIIETAEREKADLIAMASHGRTGLPRVFYGSVAAAVLQRVDRPLLLIRS